MRFFKKILKMRPKIGLVLGSGGSRGLAHIGVIKALVENNIPIDYIAGASMGAFIGAWYAKEKNIEIIKEDVLKIDWSVIADLVWDLSRAGGLISGVKLEKFIEKKLNGFNFYDLQIPFAAAATDLRSGESVILKTGVVAQAVRASMSVPFVFQPASLNNKLLVDGGLTTPVPVEAAQQMGADKIIAVNLDSADLLLSEKAKLNNLISISKRTFNIVRHNLSKLETQKADVVIEPDTLIDGVIGWKGFLDMNKIIAAGEAAALSKIEEIKNLIR